LTQEIVLNALNAVDSSNQLNPVILTKPERRRSENAWKDAALKSFRTRDSFDLSDQFNPCRPDQARATQE
jgi:hypothetical protein